MWVVKHNNAVVEIKGEMMKFQGASLIFLCTAIFLGLMNGGGDGNIGRA